MNPEDAPRDDVYDVVTYCIDGECYEISDSDFCIETDLGEDVD